MKATITKKTTSVTIGEEVFTLNMTDKTIDSRYDQTPYETDSFGDISIMDAPYGLLEHYGSEEGGELIDFVVKALNGKYGYDTNG